MRKKKQSEIFNSLFFIIEYFKDLMLPSFMHTDLVFISPETMRLLGDIHRNEQILLISTTKDQQRSLEIGLLWPNFLLADNQIGISRTMIDQLSEQQMIELRAIPKDYIQDTNNITLRYSEFQDLTSISSFLYS